MVKKFSTCLVTLTQHENVGVDILPAPCCFDPPEPAALPVA